MRYLKRDNMLSHMKSGSVFRRASLLSYSNNLDKDLAILVTKHKLKKVYTGLYYKPKFSRFGVLPPSDKSLVKAFLKQKFLMYSWNDYNALGLGLTQLYNQVVVYNHERHDVIKLANTEFNFKRANKGFPATLTREFLLVDVLNNAKYLTEDVSDLESRVQRKIMDFDREKLLYLADRYGKVGTKKLIATLVGK